MKATPSAPGSMPTTPRGADYLVASRKPYCWVAYEPPKDWHDGPRLMAILPPDLGSLRDVSKSGIWRARFALKAGRVNEALEDCLAIARCGRHRQRPTEPFFWDGLTTATLAEGEVLRILAAQPLPAEQLENIQEQLDRLYGSQYPLFDPSCDKIAFQDIVQWTFTDGGPGGGHIIPRNLRACVEFSYGGRPQQMAPAADLLGVLFYTTQAGRTDTLEKGDAIYDVMIAASKLTPYQLRDRKHVPDRMVMDLPGWRYALLRLFIPSMEEVSTLSYQGRALHEATLTILAVQRYRIDKGRYPASLEETVSAGYLQQVPADPYGSGPLVYRTTDNGFTLYSVAGNFTDDGGIAIPNDGWEPGGRDTGGDHVFWPYRAAPAPRPAGPAWWDGK